MMDLLDLGPVWLGAVFLTLAWLTARHMRADLEQSNRADLEERAQVRARAQEAISRHDVRPFAAVEVSTRNAPAGLASPGADHEE